MLPKSLSLRSLQVLYRVIYGSVAGYSMHHNSLHIPHGPVFGFQWEGIVLLELLSDTDGGVTGTSSWSFLFEKAQRVRLPSPHPLPVSCVKSPPSSCCPCFLSPFCFFRAYKTQTGLYVLLHHEFSYPWTKVSNALSSNINHITVEYGRLNKHLPIPRSLSCQLNQREPFIITRNEKRSFDFIVKLIDILLKDIAYSENGRNSLV